MATEYRISVMIDPAAALAGRAKVKQELAGIATDAAATSKAVNTAFDQSKFDRSIGSLISRFESLEKVMEQTNRLTAATSATNRMMAGSNDQVGASLSRVTQAATEAAAATTSATTVTNAASAAAQGAAQATQAQAAAATTLTTAEAATAAATARATGATTTNTAAGRANASSNAAVSASVQKVLQAVDAEALELQRLNVLLSEAKQLHDSGALSAEKYARVQALLKQGLDRSTGSLGQQRAGYTQLGFQIQDITSTAALGISPLTILAQQGGQTASALSLALGSAGTAGKVATYMAGPWGSLIIAATAILGGLALKALNTGSAFDESLKKMREDAAETEINRRAKDRFANSAEGVTAAIRAMTEATKKDIEATRTSAEQANIAAKQEYEREVQIRRTTLALAEKAKAEYAASRSSNFGAAGGAGAGMAQGIYAGRQETADKAVAQANKDLLAAEQRVNQTRVSLAFETADKQSTAVGRVTLEYDRQISALERTARAQVAAGRKIDASLTSQVVALKQRRQAAIDAAQAQTKLDSSGGNAQATQFISPVSGGRVSSGFGPRSAPTAGASTFHKGIDIAAPTGTGVKAAAGGVVIYAGRLGGLGNAIIVDHGGGTITEYGHLSSILTKKNARVGQGEKIGEVGSTGISTGAHLDYRVKTGGKYVDPRSNGGRFKTDGTSTDIRAGNAAQTAADKAERERQSAADKAARKEEQERDFVSGIEDQSATRGLGSSSNTLQGQIAKALADFKRRFDREVSPGEKTRITDALTQADARETATRFDEAYTQPLKRLQALQGKTGQDRAILNAQLEETVRLGRALTPVEATIIENSVKQGDALTRQAAILESVRQPVEAYKQQIADLNELLAKGSISQAEFNSRVSDLGRDASSFKGALPGTDMGGQTFEDVGKRDAADAERTSDLAKLQAFLDQGTIQEREAYAIREAIARKHADTIRNIDQARRQVAIDSAMSIADSLTSIAEKSAGDQSSIYKAMFAVSKAFAIADSIVKIQQGIANALSLPFPANIGAAATVAAQAVSIVSNIQAVAANFRDGGYISGAGGPRSDSIPINASNGEFMVNAQATAENRPLLEAINNGNVVAHTRRASNDNAAGSVAGAGGGGGMSFSFGDIIVQGSGDTGDGKVIGANIKTAVESIVVAKVKDMQRSGGQLTKTRSSVMSGG